MITISVNIKSPISKVWEFFNNPFHITNWNFAHESWECPSVTNDLKIGGKLSARMQAKDGSFGFDFVVVYDEVILNQSISYHLEDGRKVNIKFEKLGENETRIIESFEPEKENPIEMQQDGWQSILNNFKKYAESI